MVELEQKDKDKKSTVMLRSCQPLMGLFWDLLAERWWPNPGEVVPVNGGGVHVSRIAKQVTLSFSALFGAVNTNLYSLPVKKKIYHLLQ